MTDFIVRIGTKDITRYLCGDLLATDYTAIKDEVTNVNSFEPIERVYRSGGGSGSIRIKENKQKYFLSLILPDYQDTTYNVDYVQAPMTVTVYDRKTKAIESTEVFAGTNFVRNGGVEQETKKNTKYYTYSFDFADNFTDTSGRYFFTDELTYSEDGVKLTQEVENPDDVYLVYVKDNMEKALPHEYDVIVSEDGCSIVFNNEHPEKLQVGDKITVTYRTTSTKIL